jgi:bacillithiol system protein YtxJ
MKIDKLKDINDWEEFKKEASAGNELIIFKYSPFCGVSLFVESSFQKWADDLQESNRLRLSKVNVVTARQLSRQIAAELNVKMECQSLRNKRSGTEKKSHLI